MGARRKLRWFVAWCQAEGWRHQYGTKKNKEEGSMKVLPKCRNARFASFSVRKLQRFRGGLVVKAHRLLYHSTLGLRVIKKKERGKLQHVTGKK